jgi:uracil-DNA glycosylase
MVKTKLKWSSFEPKLGTWARVIKKGFQEGILDDVFDHLKKRNKESVVYPSAENLWRPFQLCDYNKLKLVIACDGPYKHERGDGLALSWRIETWEEYKIPAPLKSFYEEIEQAVHGGLCLEFMEQASLDYLARQGVLLLNIPLTADEEEAHTALWTPFLNYLFNELAYTGVPVLFMGEQACVYVHQTSPLQPVYTECYPGQRKGEIAEAIKQIDVEMQGNTGERLEWVEMLPF